MIYRITVTLFYKQFSNRPKYETTFPFEFNRRSTSCFGGYSGRTIDSLSHYKVVRWLPVFDQWDTVIWLLLLLKYDFKKKVISREKRLEKNTHGDCWCCHLSTSYNCIWLKNIKYILLLLGCDSISLTKKGYYSTTYLLTHSLLPISKVNALEKYFQI